MEAIIETLTPIQLAGKVEKIKALFESELKARLCLTRIPSPLFVAKKSGLNDDLNGVEKPVSFQLGGEEFQVIHSLAKWKRWCLGELKVPAGKGIVTDMRAIRADEVVSSIHAHLVDQWDWEKAIEKEERTLDTLIKHGDAVYQSLRITENHFAEQDGIGTTLPERMEIVHAEDLLQEFPNLTSKEREHAIAKKFGAVLLIGIGGKLSNGERHDLRAPDYDDWTTKDELGRPGLNADILVWDPVREFSLEISSMGVRVSEEVLEAQLKELGVPERMELPFHKQLLEGKLPFSIGGGIGQSRVAMFVAKCRDIKEVQAPVAS